MKVKIKTLIDLHKNPKSVIDIGGYLGDYSSELYKKFSCPILIFEPLKEYAEICRNRFKDNKNIKVVQMALGGFNGESVIYKSEISSSMYQGLSHSNDIETVSVGLLSDFMTNDVNLVKLNCEGSEYEILQDLIRTGWLPKIEELLIQFHRLKSYRGIGKFIRVELAKTHELIFNTKWQLWRKK